MENKEYWINVYPTGLGYYKEPTKEQCIKQAEYNTGAGFDQPIYRIHVKLDGGYNKHRYARGIDAKRYADLNKLNWMG